MGDKNIIVDSCYIIGDRIQKRRLEKHYTLQKVSKDLNISFHYLSNIEHGHLDFPVTLIIDICEYLEIDVAYIFTGSIYRTEIYGSMVPFHLLLAYEKSSKNVKEKVLKMIYFIYNM